MGGMYADPAAAIGDANDRITTDITYWLNKNLPLQANILEGATAKNDKQKEVYIDLGSREGAFAGLHLGVYTLKTVAGRDAKSQLGKLKIEAVEGDDISRCKVLGGGKEMKAALSNQRPRAPQTCALPTALNPDPECIFFGNAVQRYTQSLKTANFSQIIFSLETFASLICTST